MDDWIIELRTVVIVSLIAFLAPICLFAGVNVAVSLFPLPTMESCEKVK